jgi:predicted phage-related endonuclease
MTVEQIKELKNIENEIKALQTKADAIKDAIKTEMGSKEHITIGGFTVNYTITISTTLDSKKLKKEMPSLWKEYSKEGITRRFSISDH